MPKFEDSELAGDFPEEAQFYYEGFVDGGKAYDIKGGFEDNKLYVKDGIALYETGMGKVNAAASTQAILQDERFDFSDAYIISTGCGGGSRDYAVMGDVIICTAAVDYDLGHHADPRDLTETRDTTWFHDEAYDSFSCKILDTDLMEKVYQLTKDTPLETTERTKTFMSAAFGGADWAVRDPKVLRGTTASGDNYWKGEYNHANALAMNEAYHCPDPLAVAEMEDVAIANVADRFGLLDYLIIIRDCVNCDVFMNGATPESLWDPDSDHTLASESSVEAADIFPIAMENNYKVGKVVIDAILKGEL